MRKFLQFQLTAIIVTLSMVFIGSVVLNKSPLTAVQILWINLIISTLAIVALATESPSNDVLKRSPISLKEPVITAQMWRGIIFNSLYQITILTIMLFNGHKIFSVPYFQ